ncbi:hypothetical protein ABT340_22375 [Streptosporangium sp. NPDC000239]|uniref:hypothetical protein n=1 Tax=Streptosporangium sp. NPDC000239 TaxID=3154248 RepID=UPI00331C08BA
MSHQPEAPTTVPFLIILTISQPMHSGGFEQWTLMRTLDVGGRSTREGLLSWALDQMPGKGHGANVLFFSAEPNALPLPGVTG